MTATHPACSFSCLSLSFSLHLPLIKSKACVGSGQAGRGPGPLWPAEPGALLPHSTLPPESCEIDSLLHRARSCQGAANFTVHEAAVAP